MTFIMTSPRRTDVEKLSHSGPVTPAGLVMDAPDLKDAPIMNVTIKHHEKRGESMGIYEHMLGDAPMPDSDARTHRKSIKKRNRTKHHKQNPGSHNKGKSNKAHSTHFCSQDSDSMKDIVASSHVKVNKSVSPDLIKVLDGDVSVPVSVKTICNATSINLINPRGNPPNTFHLDTASIQIKPN